MCTYRSITILCLTIPAWHSSAQASGKSMQVMLCAANASAATVLSYASPCRALPHACRRDSAPSTLS